LHDRSTSGVKRPDSSCRRRRNLLERRRRQASRRFADDDGRMPSSMTRPHDLRTISIQAPTFIIAPARPHAHACSPMSVRPMHPIPWGLPRRFSRVVVKISACGGGNISIDPRFTPGKSRPSASCLCVYCPLMQVVPESARRGACALRIAALQSWPSLPPARRGRAARRHGRWWRLGVAIDRHAGTPAIPRGASWSRACVPAAEGSICPLQPCRLARGRNSTRLRATPRPSRPSSPWPDKGLPTGIATGIGQLNIYGPKSMAGIISMARIYGPKSMA
jgi:hypothetical protein